MNAAWAADCPMSKRVAEITRNWQSQAMGRKRSLNAFTKHAPRLEFVCVGRAGTRHVNVHVSTPHKRYTSFKRKYMHIKFTHAPVEQLTQEPELLGPLGLLVP